MKMWKVYDNDNNNDDDNDNKDDDGQRTNFDKKSSLELSGELKPYEMFVFEEKQWSRV